MTEVLNEDKVEEAHIWLSDVTTTLAPSFTSPNQSDEIRSESDLGEGMKERGER